MAGERWDYRTLRPIPDPNFARTAYNPGEGIMAQVVEDLGLEVGVDVVALRPEQVPVPSGNAKRADWAAYALARGADPDEVDAMTRDQLRAEYGDTEHAEGAQPAKGA